MGMRSSGSSSPTATLVRSGIGVLPGVHEGRAGGADDLRVDGELDEQADDVEGAAVADPLDGQLRDDVVALAQRPGDLERLVAVHGAVQGEAELLVVEEGVPGLGG